MTGESLILTLLVGSRQTQPNSKNSTSRYGTCHLETHMMHPKTAAKALGAAAPWGGGRGARRGKGPTVLQKPRWAVWLLPKCVDDLGENKNWFRVVITLLCVCQVAFSFRLVSTQTHQKVAWPREDVGALSTAPGRVDREVQATARDGGPSQSEPVQKLGELLLRERTATVLQHLVHPAHGYGAASGPV